MNNLQSLFNKVMLDLIEFISKYYPKSRIGKYKIFISSILKNDNPKGILMFIEHVYKNKQYRENIRKGNDSFFIEQADIHQHEYKRLFDLKDIWLSLDDDSQKYIKKSMLTMLVITEKYINEYEKMKINVKM